MSQNLHPALKVVNVYFARGMIQISGGIVTRLKSISSLAGLTKKVEAEPLD
jgi:hypothetical protein